MPDVSRSTFYLLNYLDKPLFSNAKSLARILNLLNIRIIEFKILAERTAKETPLQNKRKQRKIPVPIPSSVSQTSKDKK